MGDGQAAAAGVHGASRGDQGVQKWTPKIGPPANGKLTQPVVWPCSSAADLVHCAQ